MTEIIDLSKAKKGDRFEARDGKVWAFVRQGGRNNFLMTKPDFTSWFSRGGNSVYGQLIRKLPSEDEALEEPQNLCPRGYPVEWYIHPQSFDNEPPDWVDLILWINENREDGRYRYSLKREGLFKRKKEDVWWPSRITPQVRFRPYQYTWTLAPVPKPVKSYDEYVNDNGNYVGECFIVICCDDRLSIARVDGAPFNEEDSLRALEFAQDKISELENKNV